MIIAIVRQQIVGAINLSLPFIFLYHVAPHYALSLEGMMLYCFAVGIYIGYTTYVSTKNQLKALLFSPTGAYEQKFNDEIIRCGFDSKKVLVRYAYTDDAIAMTLFNTIVVDQMLWDTIQEDPEALKARDVIEKHILPSIPENKKEMHQAIKNNLTPHVQNFIFRHELAHVLYNYSYKRVLIVSLMGAAATGVALALAFKLNPLLGGLSTLLIAICAGAIADLLFAYATNFFFKAYEEKRADIFATRFSSKEEIEAAADFFEHYELAARKYRETIGSIMFRLPTTIVNGYVDGLSRARYLREIACLK